MKQRHFYARVEPSGQVVGWRAAGRAIDNPEFFPIEDWQLFERLKLNPRAYCVRDGVLGPLPEIALSATPRVIVADGESTSTIYAGGVPDGMWPVQITINGDEHEIHKDDPLEIYADPGRTGIWTILLNDPRFFNSSGSVLVHAVLQQPEATP
jgi:hypothetical protein